MALDILKARGVYVLHLRILPFLSQGITHYRIVIRGVAWGG